MSTLRDAPARAGAPATAPAPSAPVADLELASGRAAATERTLYDWFADSARATPEAPALVVGGETLSYRDLRRASDRLAREIAVIAGPEPTAIGVMSTRTPLAYAAYLATLRLGAVVVPMNPEFPAHRNAAAARRIGVQLAVGCADDVSALATSLGIAPSAARPLAAGGRALPGIAAPSDFALADRAADLAYVLFTSGSTGRPKGIPIRQRSICAHVRYCVREYEVGRGSRLSQAFDLTFDPSLFDMFVGWGGGAAVVVPQRDELADPAAFVNRNRLTHWFSVPSVVSFATRMRRLRPGSMPTLRWSLFAGEQLTLKQADAWHRAAGSSVIENLYGPTELTVTCTGYRLPRDVADWPRTSNATVPIGRVYPHLEAAILDGRGRPAPAGELCIRGVQRFDGYLDPGDDVDRFVRLDGDAAVSSHSSAAGRPSEEWFRTGDRVEDVDGALVHLGRLDGQVQVHGYRVELGEVEGTLRQHPDVLDAAVISVDGELRGFYVGTAAGPLTDWLRGRLPAYMVPPRIRRLESFPLNPNGKLDRQNLRALSC
jgi:amino acid adenylation domain-containing protein